MDTHLLMQAALVVISALSATAGQAAYIWILYALTRVGALLVGCAMPMRDGRARLMYRLEISTNSCRLCLQLDAPSACDSRARSLYER